MKKKKNLSIIVFAFFSHTTIIQIVKVVARFSGCPFSSALDLSGTENGFLPCIYFEIEILRFCKLLQQLISPRNKKTFDNIVTSVLVQIGAFVNGQAVYEFLSKNLTPTEIIYDPGNIIVGIAP